MHRYHYKLHSCLLCALQDREPLKKEADIPQSLQDQAAEQMKSLLDSQGKDTDIHMAEMVKAS